MQDAKKGKKQSITPEDIQKLRIGIVRARFNEDVTNALFYACMAELMNMNFAPQNGTIMTVPGALEVPIALQTLARRGQYDALIALGCIIRGETYHFELVANESAAGITRVALDHNLPIANAILTVENMEQAVARQSEKGAEAARVAVEMALLLRQDE